MQDGAGYLKSCHRRLAVFHGVGVQLGQFFGILLALAGQGFQVDAGGFGVGVALFVLDGFGGGAGHVAVGGVGVAQPVGAHIDELDADGVVIAVGSEYPQGTRADVGRKHWRAGTGRRDGRLW